MKLFTRAFVFTVILSLVTSIVSTADPTVDAKTPKEKVIIDTDMGELNDDAIVLFMLGNSDDVDVLGVTTVAGNTWAEEGTAYSLKQLELMNRKDIPVMQGAVEPLMGNRQNSIEAEERLFGKSEYLGSLTRNRPESYLKLNKDPYGGYPKTKPSSQHAVDFIVEQVKKNPNEITLFVIGPATNVALAVKKNPEIVPLVKQVIYMGGAIDIPGNTTPAAEFNWWYDPESIKISLHTPFKKQIIVPNDIAERVYYTKDIYDRIVQKPETPIVKMFKDLQGPRFQKDPNAKSFVWDAITAAIFLKPEIVTKMEERYIDIDTNFGPNYGRSIGYHESNRRDFDKPENFPPGTQKVQILFDIDRKAFWNLYVDLVAK